MAKQKKYFERIYLEHKDRIYNYVYRICNDLDQAQDVTQIAFIKVLNDKNLAQVKHIKAYLYTVARNALYDEWRKKKELPITEQEENDHQSLEDNDMSTPHEQIQRSDLQLKVEQAIKLLKPKFRELMYLHYVEGLSYEEIADVTKLNLSNVKVNLHRARNAFEKAFTSRMYAKLAITSKRCEYLLSMLAPFEGGEISDTEIKRIDKHITQCEICSADLEEKKKLKELFGLLPILPTPGFMDQAIAAQLQLTNVGGSTSAAVESSSNAVQMIGEKKMLGLGLTKIVSGTVLVAALSTGGYLAKQKLNEPQLDNTIQESSKSLSPTTTKQNSTGISKPKPVNNTSNQASSNPTQLAKARIPQSKPIQAANCKGKLPSSITSNTQLKGNCYLVKNLRVTNGAILTVAPGSQLVFESNGRLVIGKDSALVAKGTKNKPILVTGLQQSAGSWQGILFDRSNHIKNTLSHVIVEYGGSGVFKGNVSIIGAMPFSRVRIDNSILRHSAGYGIEIGDNNQVIFTSNVLTQNALGAALVKGNAISTLDSKSRYSGNQIDVVEVKGSRFSIEQNWKKIDVPYYFNKSHDFTIGAPITIESGNKLIFASQSGLKISKQGALNAVGTKKRPIIFTAKQATSGYWRGIGFERSNSDKNELNHVIIEYAGADQVFTGSLKVYGANPSSRVKIQNSTIRNGDNDGFYFGYQSNIQFSNNIITNNKRTGLIKGDLISVLDTASQYKGNKQDYVYIERAVIQEDQTWQAINVPYLFGGKSHNIRANVVIQAGTRILFESNGGLQINKQGSLMAKGTASKPIIFSGFEKVPGYWKHLLFDRSNSAKNLLQHTIIEYAGSNTIYTGAVVLIGTSPASRVDIKDSKIRNNASYGIYMNSGSQFNTDLLSTNEFSKNKNGKGILGKKPL